MQPARKFQFSWDLLGDIPLGRPNLGGSMRLEIYRLMQLSLRDVMEQAIGEEETERLFYDAGKLAGNQFYTHILAKKPSFDQFAREIQDTFKEMGIGVVRFEQIDLENGAFVLTVSEDLDCSGLPELGYEICTYDEGFIAGLLENFTGKRFIVKEIDCWCTGDRTCRFSAVAAD
ncbi:MAG: 4-vinyl reductase [Chloroflexi bacterium]|nr:4-vinyl reductase [Chloroflexota bacterium]